MSEIIRPASFALTVNLFSEPLGRPELPAPKRPLPSRAVAEERMRAGGHNVFAMFCGTGEEPLSQFIRVRQRL
jgi:hypothetical protein